jgi:hypothetical protein
MGIGAAASASLECGTLTTCCIVRRGAKSLRAEQPDCDLRPVRSMSDEMVEM